MRRSFFTINTDDLILDFGLRDVYLDSFFSLPECSRQVISGSEPRLCEEGCKKGFKAYSARVNFIVHWKKDKEPENASGQMI